MPEEKELRIGSPDPPTTRATPRRTLKQRAHARPINLPTVSVGETPISRPGSPSFGNNAQGSEFRSARARLQVSLSTMDEWDRRLRAFGVPMPPEDWELPTDGPG